MQHCFVSSLTGRPSKWEIKLPSCQIYGLFMWVKKSSTIKSLDFSISSRSTATNFFFHRRCNVRGIDFNVLDFFDKHEHIPGGTVAHSPLKETTLGSKTYARIRLLPYFLSPARWCDGLGFLNIKTHGRDHGMFVEIWYVPVIAHLNDNTFLLDRLNYLNNFAVSTSTWKPVNIHQIEQKNEGADPLSGGGRKELMWAVSDKASYGRVPTDVIPSEPVLYGGYVVVDKDNSADKMMVDMSICSNTAFFVKSRNDTHVAQKFIRAAQWARLVLKTKFLSSFAEKVFMGLDFGKIHKIYWTGDLPFGKIDY